MREANVTADRMICRDLLGVLIVMRDIPLKEQPNDVKSLSEFVEIDESQCRQILDEMVACNIVLQLGQRYVISDESFTAWQLQKSEASFNEDC